MLIAFIVYELVAAMIAHYLSKKAKGFTLFAYIFIGHLWPMIVLSAFFDVIRGKEK